MIDFEQNLVHEKQKKYVRKYLDTNSHGDVTHRTDNACCLVNLNRADFGNHSRNLDKSFHICHTLLLLQRHCKDCFLFW